MATLPQPPRPPAPPAPPHSGSHILAIVLLVLALIVALSVAAVWFGVRLISHNVRVEVNDEGANRKEVNIKTPVGNFEVTKDANAGEAQLGLPFYPGAVRVKDENHGGGSVSLDFDLPDQNSLRIVVAKFQTPDSLDKVREFYKQRIGGEVTKLTQNDAKTTFEIKSHQQEKVVALETRDGGTRIALVHVLHGRAEPN